MGGSVDGLSALVSAVHFLGHLFLQIKAVVNILGPETSPVLVEGTAWRDAGNSSREVD